MNVNRYNNVQSDIDYRICSNAGAVSEHQWLGGPCCLKNQRRLVSERSHSDWLLW